METTTYLRGLAAVGLMSIALACEQERSPTAPTGARSAALSASRVGSLSGGAAAGEFTTIDGPGATLTVSVDIGPTGDIVGRYVTGDGTSHGYLLHDGVLTTIDFSATFTSAQGINANGDIVGSYRGADGRSHWFLLRAGTFTTIDVPSAVGSGRGGTNAFGINPRGDIVGMYCDPACPPPAYNANLGNHGFLLRDGSFTTIDFPGAVVTQAFKINAAGDIVGRYQSANGKWHAFLLSEEAFTSIDVAGAIHTASFAPPVGINAPGDIVSSYCAAEPCPRGLSDNLATTHGFLLRREDGEEDGHFTTIDFPGAVGTNAFGINASGDIVGAYVDASHRAHGFLARLDVRPDGLERVE